MKSLRLCVLGIPDVRLDGQPVHLRTRKMLGLLAYLAVEGRPHGRDELAELLWPSTPETSRAALRLALHHLGTALGAAGLDVDRNHVELRRFEGLWVDVLVLEACAENHSRDPEAADTELWRGDFLQGLALLSASPTWDEWVSRRTRQAGEHYDTLLARLAHHQLAAGQIWDAIATARRRVDHQPLEEDAYVLLAQAQLAADQSAEAHKTLRACRRMLERDLGLEPAAGTLALEARLRGQTATAAASADLPPTLIRGALIGRTTEFARLADVYRRAAHGEAQAVVLSGEPGIGKTRLAGELLAWARSRGARVLHGRAPEVADQPFAPITEALQRETTLLGAALAPASRHDLARLLPTLQAGPPEPVEGDIRPRLYEALGAAVVALAGYAAGEPVVLLVDDLQWADSGTLEALLYLATTLTLTPLLLLLTARTEYLGTGQPLDAWLARLRRALPLLALALEPLGARDTRHLLASVLPRAAGPLLDRLAHWLHGETGGQPLYLTETLRSLREGGALSDDPAGLQLHEARLPHGVEGVRAAIAERLSRLSPSALALAQAAAVLGREDDFEVLCEVADLNRDAALPAYEELLRCGLLLEHGRGAEALVLLSHDRVRETLRDALAAPRRAELHRRAFLALSTRGVPPAVLAGHAAQGGHMVEGIRLYEQAARAAQALGAYDEAAVALQRAVNLRPRRPDQQDARVRLLAIANRLYFERDASLSAAMDATRRAAADAGTAGLPGEQAALLGLLTMDLLRSGQLQEAETCAHSALAAARAAGQIRAEAQALVSLARIETARWNWLAAESYGERARRMAESEDEDVALLAELALAIARRWSVGALEPARRQIAALLPRARAWEQRCAAPTAEEEGIVQRVLWELMWQDVHVEAFDDALHHLAELEGIGGRPWEMIWEARGLIYLRQGDLPGALAVTGAALDKTERCHLRFPNVYGIWALCLLQSGRPDEARRAVERGQSVNPAYDHVRDRADSALRFGEVLLALGDAESALHEYRWALETYSLPHVLGGLRGVAEVWERLGEVAAAAACCGVVLGHGAAGRFEEGRAQAVFDRLRSSNDAALVEEAARQAEARPLVATVKHVLNCSATVLSADMWSGVP